MKRFSSLLLLWVAVSSLALAEDDWTGLWRINRFYEGKLDGSYHLFIVPDGDGLALTVYTDDARPMILQQLEFTADHMELRVANSVKQPLPLLFKLTREGGKISGEWVFSQMQLMTPVTGEAVGFRVTASTSWTPWPFLKALEEKGKTSVDLAGMLWEKAPRKNFEKFLDFWDREIELPYYFVVQSTVYGAARDRDARLEVLKPFFELLKARSSTLSLLQEFTGIASRVEKAEEIRTPTSFRTFLVNWPFLPDSEASHELALWTRTPTPEEEAACACVLDLRERFLLTDGLAFSDRGEQAAQLWEEALVRDALWTRAAPSLGVEVYRRGLARLLTLQGRDAKIPELGTEQRAEMAAEIKKLLKAPLPDNPEEVAAEADRWVDFGSYFAQQMISQTTLQEVLRRADRDVLHDWEKFLQPE